MFSRLGCTEFIKKKNSGALQSLTVDLVARLFQMLVQEPVSLYKIAELTLLTDLFSLQNPTSQFG